MDLRERERERERERNEIELKYLKKYQYSGDLKSDHLKTEDLRLRLRLRFIDGWLSRCCTARGSITRFSVVSPTKVQDRK